MHKNSHFEYYLVKVVFSTYFSAYFLQQKHIFAWYYYTSYYISQGKSHTIPRCMSAINTAALPMSFACLENSCFSKPILLTVASTAVFSASASNTTTYELNRYARMAGVELLKNSIAKIAHPNTNSCKNARSLNKYLMPLIEYRKAFIIAMIFCFIISSHVSCFSSIQ